MTSEACNLNCKYCYIERTKNNINSSTFYLEEHKKITQALEDKTYINNYLKALQKLKIDPKTITTVELWGQEPTLNLESFFKNFDYLYQHFPNLKGSIFSTNGVSNTHKILDAINIIDNIIDKEFNFSVQFSIDGSQYTKENRGIEVEIILNNIENLIKELNKIKLQKIKVDFHLHNVLGQNVFTSLKTLEEIDSYWEELNNFAKKLKNLNLNKNVFFADLCYPSLEMPIKATQQDGIDLYNFIYYSNIGKGKDNLFGMIKNLFKPNITLKNENLTLDDLILIISNLDCNQKDKIDFFNNLSRGCGCGNQISSLKMAYNGEMVFCQTAMFKRREEDFINYVDDSDPFFHNLVKHNRYINILTASQKEIENYFNFYKEYNLSAFGIKFTNCLNLMLWLSDSNLIEPVYKTNKKKLLRHAFICAGIQKCAHNDIIETGSIYGRSVELIKLYCNGFISIVEDYIVSEGNNNG